MFMHESNNLFNIVVMEDESTEGSNFRGDSIEPEVKVFLETLKEHNIKAENLSQT
jgi:hypothetical protein